MSNVKGNFKLKKEETFRIILEQRIVKERIGRPCYLQNTLVKKCCM